MKYKAEFTGRNLGAIGLSYKIVAEIEADDEEHARRRLYDRYDHIQGLKLTPIEEAKP